MTEDAAFGTRSPLLVTAAALVDASGRVLVQQRPLASSHGGLWEFPGGKVEPGETMADALVRELGEELAITVAAGDLIPLSFATAPHDRRELLLLLFVCTRWQGEPRAQQADRIAWLAPAALPQLAMPPADRAFPAAITGWIASRA